MSKALALLVGLKGVDPAKYRGWDGTNGCSGCEPDVDSVEAILRPLGYVVTTLKTAQATADNILHNLKTGLTQLDKGDILVFFFAGHGGQQPDRSGDELDGRDETVVAYDREILDDEFNDLWLQTKEGVRVVMLSDSCNSGTNYRMARDFSEPTPFIPIADSRIASEMKAQLIHMGGCRDGFTSAGYAKGGAFTIALDNAWDQGRFQGDYPGFHSQICNRIATKQKPQYNEYGAVASQFKSQRPFAI